MEKKRKPSTIEVEREGQADTEWVSNGLLSTKDGCGCSEPEKRRKMTFVAGYVKSVLVLLYRWMTARGQCANGQGFF